MPDDPMTYKNEGGEVQSAGAENTPILAKKKAEDDTSQTEKAFKEYCEEVLEEEIKNADNDQVIANASFESNKETRRVKTNELIWARNTQHEYTMFCNSISSLINQGAIETTANIEELKNLNKDLSEKLNGALAAIKTAKEKLAAADGAANNLGEGIKDSCNSKQVKIIRSELNDGLKECVDDIIAGADVAHDKGDDAFEAAVKVSAINAFTNIDSLTEFGAATESKIGAFHKDVLTNVNYGTDQVLKAQEDLKGTLTKLTESEYDKFGKELCVTSLEDTKSFAEDKTPPAENDLNLICEGVESTFFQTEPEEMY